MKLNTQRIRALFLRHLYPLRRDFDIWTDVAYWPIIDALLWGITGQWLSQSSNSQLLVKSLMTSLILWNIVWRSQSEVARNLLEELWNNNLVNLFSTPLQLKEWVVSVLCLSFLKTAITLAVLIPVIFLLYKVNVFTISWWFIPFYLCATMTGWIFGFISSSIVIRQGQKMQTVVWALPGILLPLSAVYFPFSSLPDYIKPISRVIPTTYIFEGMRSLIFEGRVDASFILLSFGLNVLFLSIAISFFVRSFKKSKQLGFSRFN